MSTFEKRFGHNTVALVETAVAFTVGITLADVLIKNITESDTIDDVQTGSWISLIVSLVIAAVLLLFFSWFNNRKAKRWKHVSKDRDNYNSVWKPSHSVLRKVHD